MLAANITDPTQKRALLLYLSGSDVQELFDILPDTSGDKDFEVAVKKLTDYFAQNKTQILRFTSSEKPYSPQRLPEENLEAHYTRLRKLATACNFENSDEEIKRMYQLIPEMSRIEE